MKKTGVVLIIAGLLSFYLVYGMGVNGNVNYLAGFLFFVGWIVLALGFVNKEKSKDLAIFSLQAFLTPVILVVLFKGAAYYSEKFQKQALESVAVIPPASVQTDVKKIDTQRKESHQTASVSPKKESSAKAKSEAEQSDKNDRENKAEPLTPEQEKAMQLAQENAKEFVDHSDGTITHLKTGLTWQRCSVGQAWDGQICNGEATFFTWDEAMNLTSDLADKTDWRLPNKEELSTLIFCSDGNYNSNGECANGKIAYPTINQAIFPNTLASIYWTASPYTNMTQGAWLISFDNGTSNTSSKNDSYYVRLVR